MERIKREENEQSVDDRSPYKIFEKEAEKLFKARY